MNGFDEAVVLITGAASEIGRATALNFARQGASVSLLDTSALALGPVAAEAIRLGGKALIIEADVTRSESVRKAIEETVAVFGRLTSAVAAAGVAERSADDDGERGRYAGVPVNLTGAYLTARHAMPHLLEHGNSSFVAVSSETSLCGSTGYTAYSASKHGVIGLVDCLALDYGPRGVRSNAVCPSFVEMRIRKRLAAGDHGPSLREGRGPIGQFARPAEVAEAIIHLASAKAGYINGMCYVIDGGTTVGERHEDLTLT